LKVRFNDEVLCLSFTNLHLSKSGKKPRSNKEKRWCGENESGWRKQELVVRAEDNSFKIGYESGEGKKQSVDKEIIHLHYTFAGVGSRVARTYQRTRL
jgi:hypothetical protein